MGATGPLVNKQNEWAFVSERISDLNFNQYGANFYADFPRVFEGAPAGLDNITPYVGVGFSNLDLNMQYSGVFHRIPDPVAYMAAAPDSIPNETLARSAAGTLSSANFHLAGDNTLAASAMIGFDYSLTNRIKVGVQGRWTRTLDDLVYSDYVWNPLRSHDGTMYPGGPLVQDTITIQDGLDLWDASVQLKVNLGKLRGKKRRSQPQQ